MKKFIMTAVAAIVIVGTLTACDEDADYYDTICVNPYSQVRVDYYQCQAHTGWVYYIHSGDVVPGVNSRLRGYNSNGYKQPSNATVKKNGVSTKGGKAPTVKSGGGVSVIKPKGGSNNKPGGGGFKPAAPKPAPKVGGFRK